MRRNDKETFSIEETRAHEAEVAAQTGNEEKEEEGRLAERPRFRAKTHDEGPACVKKDAKTAMRNKSAWKEETKPRAKTLFCELCQVLGPYYRKLVEERFQPHTTRRQRCRT